MSFHAAGTNVGDTCTIPLPAWVHSIGDENPDIFYTDAAGTRNRECLSLGCFQHSVLAGRTPCQVCITALSVLLHYSFTITSPSPSSAGLDHHHHGLCFTRSHDRSQVQWAYRFSHLPQHIKFTYQGITLLVIAVLVPLQDATFGFVEPALDGCQLMPNSCLLYTSPSPRD